MAKQTNNHDHLVGKSKVSKHNRQIVIPKGAYLFMRLEPGNFVEFRIEEERVYLVKVEEDS
jgi:bifunctional DNA-binding transcriptional regulator/antitoxin component of YhaV-PrlF toxin-antitoxin module